MLSMRKFSFSLLGRDFFSYTSVIACRSRNRTSRTVLSMTPRAPRTLFRHQSRRPQQLFPRPPPRARPARMSPSRHPSRVWRGADLRCPAPARDAPSPAVVARCGWRRPPPRPPTPLPPPPPPLPLTPRPLLPTVDCGEGRRPRLAAGTAALWSCRRGGSFLWRRPPPRPPTPLPPPQPRLLLTPPPLSPTFSCGERLRPRMAAGTAALWHIRRAPAAAVAAVAF